MQGIACRHGTGAAQVSADVYGSWVTVLLLTDSQSQSDVLRQYLRPVGTLVEAAAVRRFHVKTLRGKGYWPFVYRSLRLVADPDCYSVIKFTIDSRYI